MKLFVVLFSLFNVSPAFPELLKDAENKEEAVGIVFSQLKKIDVLKFMCERKIPESTEMISSAVSNWLTINKSIIEGLYEELDQTPTNELEELLGIAELLVDNIIVGFNDLDRTAKVESCNELVDALNTNGFKAKFPKAYEFLEK